MEIESVGRPVTAHIGRMAVLWILVQICLSCSPSPESLKIRVAPGYRGPIAIVGWGAGGHDRMQQHDYTFAIPETGICKVDGVASPPNYYVLDVAYLNGQKIAVADYGDASRSDVAYRGGGLLYDDDGTYFYWAFIGTEGEYENMDIAEWARLVNQHTDPE